MNCTGKQTGDPNAGFYLKDNPKSTNGETGSSQSPDKQSKSAAVQTGNRQSDNQDRQARGQKHGD